MMDGPLDRTGVLGRSSKRVSACGKKDGFGIVLRMFSKALLADTVLGRHGS